MNQNHGGSESRHPRRKAARQGSAKPGGRHTGRQARSTSGPVRRSSPRAAESVRVVEQAPQPEPLRPFRILIAVHRPRFRGRAERAAALSGWEVVSLLNKQDPIGQVSSSAGPPDIFVLSGDFGRQKDLAIFRAVQSWRTQGMTLVGMVEDCEQSPAGHPGASASKLCDICLTPPYKTAELRELFTGIYEAIFKQQAPPPVKAAEPAEDPDEE